MLGRRRWNRAGAARGNFRPGVEVLEDRLAPATVTNLLDDGSPGSLRAVLAAAQSGDTINFAVTGTIRLTQGPLQVAVPSLTISGPGANQLTISGGGASQIFVVGPEAGLGLSGLTLANGLAVSGADAFGGAIDSLGSLAIDSCAFVGNSAIQGGDQACEGGAIYAQGPTTITSSTFVGNSTGGQGGAVLLNGVSADDQVTGCTFVGNSASQGGALANFNLGGTEIAGCSFVGNSAGFQGGAVFASGPLDSFFLIEGSSFSGNSAPTGASIFTLNPLNLETDSFTQNSPDNGLGGIAGVTPNFVLVLATTGESFLATAGAGSGTQLLAQFTDLESDGPTGLFSATVSWGDGSEPDAATTVLPAGTDSNGFQVFDVFGAHTYTTDGTYAIQVRIIDESEDVVTTASATSAAVVLTANQSAQLTGSETTTGQAGSSTLSAAAPDVDAVLTGISTINNATTTLFVGSYAGNPTSAPSTGAAFYDVRATNASDGSLLVSFHYPAGVSDPVLLFFNPATQSFQPVQSALVVNDTAHHVLTVLINVASVPTLATLDHTVFTIGVGLPASPAGPDPATVTQLLASTGNTLPAPSTTTFASSSQLTLTLAPLQQGQLALSQAAVIGAAGGDGQADSSDVPFRWAWDLFGLEQLWRTLSAPPNRGGPQEAAPPAGTEENSSPDQPGNGAGAGVFDESLLRPDGNQVAPAVWASMVAPDLASKAEYRAAVGLLFAGAALLQDRRRRPAV